VFFFFFLIYFCLFIYELYFTNHNETFSQSSPNIFPISTSSTFSSTTFLGSSFGLSYFFSSYLAAGYPDYYAPFN